MPHNVGTVAENNSLSLRFEVYQLGMLKASSQLYVCAYVSMTMK